MHIALFPHFLHASAPGSHPEMRSLYSTLTQSSLSHPPVIPSTLWIQLRSLFNLLPDSLISQDPAHAIFTKQTLQLLPLPALPHIFLILGSAIPILTSMLSQSPARPFPTCVLPMSDHLGPVILPPLRLSCLTVPLVHLHLTAWAQVSRRKLFSLPTGLHTPKSALFQTILQLYKVII